LSKVRWSDHSCVGFIDTARTGYYSVGDVTFKFKDKAAAENFKPGDRFWIMDVSPGATFRINRISAAFG